MIFLAGGIVKFRIISEILRKRKIKNLCVFDGVKSPWHGGRVNTYVKDFSPSIVKYYNKRNIGFYCAFSNDIIDVTLPKENKILEFLNQNPLNGVIIANDDFREYIRKYYPNLKICLSITSFDSIDVPKNIKELEDKYDYICPRFEMIFNPDFLKVIDPKKYKIMLNDTCRYSCKLWRKHFSEISRYNRDNLGDPNKIQECWLPYFDPNVPSKYECMDLDINALKKCKEIGYENFKISGRELNDKVYTDEIIEYLDLLEKI